MFNVSPGCVDMMRKVKKWDYLLFKVNKTIGNIVIDVYNFIKHNESCGRFFEVFCSYIPDLKTTSFVATN
jgi:hypothetical protein